MNEQKMVEAHTILRVSDFIFINDVFFAGGEVSLKVVWFNKKEGYILFWGAGQNSLLATEELFFKVVGDSSMSWMRFHVTKSLETPKFNSSPLKNGGWKTALLSYWEGRGYVKLWECIIYIIHVFQPSFQWFRVQNNKNINALLAKVDGLY